MAYDEMEDDTTTAETAGAPAATENVEQPESERKLVQRILGRIKADKKHHKKAFDRMRRDMRVAMHGADPETWDEGNYRANVAGRHVKQKVAALYAKNPRIVAKKRERLDFVLWDETPESLMMAQQTVQAFTMMAVAPMGLNGGPPMMGEGAPGQIGPGGLEMGGMAPMGPPPEVMQAQAVLDDFTQGMQRRQMLDRTAKTLELLFLFAMQTQKPLDFKTALKQVVRRTCTTAVGYVRLDYQREYGPREGITEQMQDYRERLDHLRRLAEEAAEGEIEETDAEIAELEAALQALATEPEIIVNEGLVFDYPRSTKVIPDRNTKSLVGWVGADHLSLEYDRYTVDDVKEMFGVDLGKKYTAYTGREKDDDSANTVNESWENDETENRSTNCDHVLVWEHFDRKSGLVYFVADGHDKFLKPPAAPNVFVEQFFPIHVLTFNECESETELFPPSDVALLKPMQDEINRSREGKRQHRKAAVPRWAAARGVFDEDTRQRLETAKPYEVVETNLPPGTDIKGVLQAFPVPGVDPNLYDTNEVFADLQVVVGTQEALLGGLSKATATESSISASASATTDGASVDDLDNLMERIARDGGAILLREMAEEKVKAVVGPGAVWPHMTLAEIADEIWLEVEAGSSGKPNQAVEINNWKTLLPFLLQIPGVRPEWLLRQTIRRLDDKLDVTEAIAPNTPAIMALNRMAGQAPIAGDPAAAPEQQGPEGADKTPAPDGSPSGSDAPMGDNHAP